MSEDGRFFRHVAQGTPVSGNSRYATPQYCRKQKDSLLTKRQADDDHTPKLPFLLLSPSVDELKVDTAKLDRPGAAYLLSKKNLPKYLFYR